MTTSRKILWVIALFFSLISTVLLFVGIWIPDDPRILQTFALATVLAAVHYLILVFTYMEHLSVND